MGKNSSQLITTEGIKYAGSKLKIIPRIFELLNGEGVKYDTFLDVFSGTTRVTQAFSQRGVVTTSNDISEWSEVFATCYLLSRKEDKYYQELIDHLNSLEGKVGWFTENYGGEISDIKKPFQIHNTKKLDVIREEIDNLNLSWEDKCVLLTSLIYALDRVDNTLGHYTSYLSTWSSRSHKTMELKLPKRFKVNDGCNVCKEDALSVVGEYHDLMYLDPPYGSNNEKMPSSRVRYGAYYHFWKTVILNDKPEVFGKASRRTDTRDELCYSPFEDFRKDEYGKHFSMVALDKLITNSNCEHLVLSYSSGGRTTKEELFDILNTRGDLIRFVEFDYRKNVMSSMSWTKEWLNGDDKHTEYLFLLKKK